MVEGMPSQTAAPDLRDQDMLRLYTETDEAFWELIPDSGEYTLSVDTSFQFVPIDLRPSPMSIITLV